SLPTLSNTMPRGRPPDLNRRSLIARLRAAGLTYRQIGQRLGVSRQCVQHALRYTDSARLVPIRCRKCGKTIAWMRPVHSKRGTVYCVDCLPATAPFGQQLRAYRLAARFTQAELAKRIGVPQATVHCWERGWKKPGSSMLAKLVAVLGAGLNRDR